MKRKGLRSVSAVLRRFAILSVVSLSTFGCSEAGVEGITSPEPPPPPSPPLPAIHSVAIEPAGGVLRWGQDVQLRAVARDAQGNELHNRTQQWSSSSPAIVTVSQSGVVRGAGAGHARVGVRVEWAEAFADFEIPSHQVSVRFDRPGLVSVLDLNHDLECDHDCTRPVPFGATLQLRMESGVGTPATPWPAPCPDPHAETCAISVESDLMLEFSVSEPPHPRDFRTVVSMGQDVGCALTEGGDIACWGSNYAGQLGRGDSGGYSTEPVRVAHTERFHTVTVGFDHACALTESGATYCWGNNGWGALGSGFRWNLLKPELVRGDPRFVQISAGMRHTCAVTGDGLAYCWGGNEHGQLGDGSRTMRLRPTRVSGDDRFKQVSSGSTFTCGLTVQSELRCWGLNDRGQLGAGNLAPALLPTQSASPARYRDVQVGGNMGCAVREEGGLDCWGEDESGNLGLGLGSPQIISTPTRLPGNLAFVSASIGDQAFACGRTALDEVSCWGRNFQGMLGNGKTDNSNVPTPVSGGHRFRAIASGNGTSCGIDLSGELHCWGRAGHGVLGPDVVVSSATPMEIMGIPLSDSIVAHAWQPLCAITRDVRGLDCWGGWGPLVHRAESWVVTRQLENVGSVAFGGGHICTIPAGDSSVVCYGNGARGRLGNGSFTGWFSGPGHRIAHPTPLVQVRAGIEHTCALDAGGLAFCWGANDRGQLGNGGWSDRSSPAPVLQGAVRFSQISAGFQRTCGIALDRSLWCWGGNESGQIGDGTEAHRNRPTQVRGNLEVKSVFLGSSHTCALSVDGAAHCWGNGRLGQLGRLTERNQLTPLKVPGTPTFDALALGNQHSCGLAAGGAIWCWGENWYGQLGLGHDQMTDGPEQVPGTPSFTSIAASGQNTCALAGSGRVWCWGTNAQGQLGLEVPWVPVRIFTPLRFHGGAP